MTAQQHSKRNYSSTTTTTRRQSWQQVLVTWLVRTALSVIGLVGMLVLIAAPPLHLLYEPMKPAGPSSVCVQGAGFPGFWYHLGFLQDNLRLDGGNQHYHEDDDQEFYCYSSGCLSLLTAYRNATLQEAHGYASRLQQSWLDGNMSRYAIVEQFIDDLLRHGATDQNFSTTTRRNVVETQQQEGLDDWFLSRTHILITSADKGVTAERASDWTELRDLLIKTTFIPFVTGWGWSVVDTVHPNNNSNNNTDAYIDGGFSRMLHPQCQHNVVVPTTGQTVLHAFNPGLSENLVEEFWLLGKAHGQSFGQARRPSEWTQSGSQQEEPGRSERDSGKGTWNETDCSVSLWGTACVPPIGG